MLSVAGCMHNNLVLCAAFADNPQKSQSSCSTQTQRQAIKIAKKKYVHGESLCIAA